MKIKIKKIILYLIIFQLLIISIPSEFNNDYQNNNVLAEIFNSIYNTSRDSHNFFSGPAWTSVGDDQENALYGYAIACAGDVNNDGYSDIIIGARYYDTPNENAGKAYLYLGNSEGLNTTPVWTSEGDNQTGAGFGSSVAGAGDVNNDSYDDVIIGSYCYSTSNYRAGKAYLYLGSPSGLQNAPVWTSSGDDQKEAYYGESVAMAGDVNNDGYDDVIVGAPEFNTDQPNAGKAYLYLGSIFGLSTSPAWTSSGDNAGGDFIGSYYGYPVSNAGDVNKDGFDDIIVGAPLINNYSGKVYLYLGNENGLTQVPVWISVGDNQSKAQFGATALSAGDVNNDGYGDVIIGAALYNAENLDTGKAYLYLGSPYGLETKPIWTSIGDGVTGDAYGTSAAGAGDINNDGFDDIIVGASSYYQPPGPGKVYLYLGSSNGASPEPIWTSIADNQINAQYGYPVSSAGNVNNDSYADFIVGAYLYDTQNIDAGKAYLYLGGIPPVVPPVLKNGTVIPNSSDNEDLYEYKVTYIDPNNIPGPHKVKIIIDFDGPSPIEKDMFFESGHNTSGAIYKISGIKLSIGQHNYKINATNGKHYAEEIFGTGPEVVKANQPPYWDESAGISDKVEINEDSGEFYFDLNKAFTDPDGDILNFTIHNSFYSLWRKNTETDLLTAKIIDSNKSIEILPKLNMFGYQNIHVRATDPEGLLCQHTINITILSVNDPPIINDVSHWQINDETIVDITRINIISGEQDHWINLTINVTDIDSENFKYGTSIINTDKPPPDNFEIDSPTGEIRFLPTNDDVGTIKMNITVEDDGIPKGDDFLVMSFEIENTNDPPKIISINQIQLGFEYNEGDGIIDITDEAIPIQDEWFNLSVNVVDIDMDTPFGEEFRFYTNITDEISGLVEYSNFKFDIKTGNLSIRPANNMTNRVYFFKLVVMDNNGYFGYLSDSIILKLKIKNRNDPPNTPIILTPSYPYIFNTTEKINFKAYCNDPDQYVPDSNETLTYSWESHYIGLLNGDEIDKGRELKNVIISKPGVHFITLTVTDSSGSSSNASFMIEIVERDEKENVKEGFGIEFWFTLAIVLILIIIVVFLYFQKIRKRMRKVT